MDGRGKKKYYVVREDILPDSIMKTVKAKEMMACDEVHSVVEAVNKLGIARSTFYKYKDRVFAYSSFDNSNILNISLRLEHVAGVLSRVLNCLASLNVNILTINQSLPLHGSAHVTLSLSTQEMKGSGEELIESLKHISGVIKVEIIGKS
ncbi:MAG: ACT domain-containing protein [Syntrophomonadaceae bacterium]|nr:ACT domain-containing protein [Syntrophomonadaceae bacterium]